MAYRNDPDLEFLGNISSDDLDPLVQLLIEKGKLIPGINTEKLTVPGINTEKLTGSSEYKEHNPDHHAYWKLIAAEIQLFGASTIASRARGVIGGEVKGVLYREILTDVCDKQKVNYNKRSSVPTIEHNLLMKVLVDSVEKISPKSWRRSVERSISTRRDTHPKQSPSPCKRRSGLGNSVPTRSQSLL